MRFPLVGADFGRFPEFVLVPCPEAVASLGLVGISCKYEEKIIAVGAHDFVAAYAGCKSNNMLITVEQADSHDGTTLGNLVHPAQFETQGVARLEDPISHFHLIVPFC